MLLYTHSLISPPRFNPNHIHTHTLTHTHTHTHTHTRRCTVKLFEPALFGIVQPFSNSPSPQATPLFEQTRSLNTSVAVTVTQLTQLNPQTVTSPPHSYYVPKTPEGAEAQGTSAAGRREGAKGCGGEGAAYLNWGDMSI